MTSKEATNLLDRLGRIEQAIDSAAGKSATAAEALKGAREALTSLRRDLLGVQNLSS